MKFETKIKKILEVESDRLVLKDDKLVNKISQFAKDLSLYGLYKDFTFIDNVLKFKYFDFDLNKNLYKEIKLDEINFITDYSKYIKNLKKEINKNNKKLREHYEIF